MQITSKSLTPTKVELTIVADADFLATTKDHVLNDLAKDVNLAGFRKGHAPKALIEKNVDQGTFQSQFIEHALNDMYGQAVSDQRLRPVAQPEVNITKFVPFT